MGRPSKYPDELRERAVRMVAEVGPQYPSQWAEALETHKSEAIEIQSEEVYERYMKYLTGCANLFRIGHIDVNQFTLEK